MNVRITTFILGLTIFAQNVLQASQQYVPLVYKAVQGQSKEAIIKFKFNDAEVARMKRLIEEEIVPLKVMGILRGVSDAQQQVLLKNGLLFNFLTDQLKGFTIKDVIGLKSCYSKAVDLIWREYASRNPTCNLENIDRVVFAIIGGMPGGDGVSFDKPSKTMVVRLSDIRLTNIYREIIEGFLDNDVVKQAMEAFIKEHTRAQPQFTYSSTPQSSVVAQHAGAGVGTTPQAAQGCIQLLFQGDERDSFVTQFTEVASRIIQGIVNCCCRDNNIQVPEEDSGAVLAHLYEYMQKQLTKPQSYWRAIALQMCTNNLSSYALVSELKLNHAPKDLAEFTKSIEFSKCAQNYSNYNSSSGSCGLHESGTLKVLMLDHDLKEIYKRVADEFLTRDPVAVKMIEEFHNKCLPIYRSYEYASASQSIAIGSGAGASSSVAVEPSLLSVEQSVGECFEASLTSDLELQLLDTIPEFLYQAIRNLTSVHVNAVAQCQNHVVSKEDKANLRVRIEGHLRIASNNKLFQKTLLCAALLQCYRSQPQGHGNAWLQSVISQFNFLYRIAIKNSFVPSSEIKIGEGEALFLVPEATIMDAYQTTISKMLEHADVQRLGKEAFAVVGNPVDAAPPAYVFPEDSDAEGFALVSGSASVSSSVSQQVAQAFSLPVPGGVGSQHTPQGGGLHPLGK